MAVEVSGLQPTRGDKSGSSLVDVVEVVLDKGLVINADIAVSVAGVELLGIKIRAALASFETAARYGLEFPSGTDINSNAGRKTPTSSSAKPRKRGQLAILLIKLMKTSGRWSLQHDNLISLSEDIVIRWIDSQVGTNFL